jgi:hypothetical protein
MFNLSKCRSDGVAGYSFEGKQYQIRRKSFRVVNISAISNNKIFEYFMGIEVGQNLDRTTDES